jgi:hypothetical protein
LSDQKPSAAQTPGEPRSGFFIAKSKLNRLIAVAEYAQRAIEFVAQVMECNA